MDKNKIYIIIAIIFILVIAAFMLFDFIDNSSDTENVYEYKLDNFTNIDKNLVTYFEARNFNTKLHESKGIAVDQNDNIYVSGSNKIMVFNKDGDLTKEIETNFNPGSIITYNNNIYFGSDSKIIAYHFEDNSFEEIAKLEPNSIITSLAIIDTTLFVADAGTKLVYGLSLNGDEITIIGKKDTVSGHKGFIIPSGYFDIVRGRDNELWIVNPGRHQLESYTTDGKFISSWKSTSMELDGFSGCCNPTHIAILNDGSFVTSEKGIIRVKIVDPTGKFKTVVATPDDFEKGTTGLDIAVDSEERIILLDPIRNQVRIFEKK